MDICSQEEPAFEPVMGDHLASCWIYQQEDVKNASGKENIHNG